MPSCGEYSGWYHLDILDDVIARLRDVGIFVMLDMHTLGHPEYNDPIWCTWTPCTAETEKRIFDAWKVRETRIRDAL